MVLYVCSDWALCAQEGDYGCSRDEMAAALVDVSEGRIPKDRIALRALYSDLKNWPFLGSEAELDDEGTSADYSGITNTGWSISRHAPRKCSAISASAFACLSVPKSR